MSINFSSINNQLKIKKMQSSQSGNSSNVFRQPLTRDTVSFGNVTKPKKPVNMAELTGAKENSYSEYVKTSKKINEIILSKVDPEILKKYPDLDEASKIRLALRHIYKEEDGAFLEDEIQAIKDFVSRYNAYANISSDESEEELLELYARVFQAQNDSRQRQIDDIAWVLSCNKNNLQLTDEEFNLKEKRKTLYKIEAPTMSNEELSLYKRLIADAKSTDRTELISRCNFDYSKLHERNIYQLVVENINKDLRGVSESAAADKIAADLLYCSDEEFIRKFEILQRRPVLLSPYAKTIPFESWKTLLNMSDTDFARVSTPIEQREYESIDGEKYRQEIESRINEPLRYSVGDAVEVVRKRKENRATNEFFAALSKKNEGYKPNKLFPFKKLPKQKGEVKTLPTTKTLMDELESKGSISLNIEQMGGLNPTRNEEPIIHENDREQLGVVQSARMKIKYGTKTNWSNTKIARDIMQNFYDGNGHTLEGTSVNIIKQGKKYKIKITGQGNYDYSHLQVLGSSTKEGDADNAGHFGEGTRIVAVNLLAKPDISSVEYACGDWKMQFGRSSDDLATADMTKILSQNDERVEGNYIEFSTENEELVQEIINSKDYFYHPQNTDFQNLDWENEVFGYKLLSPGEKGNIYLVQRYETSKGIEGSLDGVTLVFKTMPNNPAILAKDFDKKFSLGVGRDRNYLNENDISELIQRYAKTISNEDIILMLSSLEELWTYNDSAQKINNRDAKILLCSLIQEAKRRHIGIDFEELRYAAVPQGAKKEDIEMAKIMGYKLCHEALKEIGMPLINMADEKTMVPIEPDEKEVRRLHLLEEGVKIIQENLGLDSFSLITEKDALAPRFVFNKGGGKNTAAEAIISEEGYEGHFVRESSLMLSDFVENLATWIHEITHKYGSDTSSEFSDSLISIETNIIKILASNPQAREKMSILAELYNENGNEVTRQTDFNRAQYSDQISKQIGQSTPYIEYTEETETVEGKGRNIFENTNVPDLSAPGLPKVKSSVLDPSEIRRAGLLGALNRILHRGRNIVSPELSNATALKPTPKSPPESTTVYPYQKPETKHQKPIKTLPGVEELFKSLSENNSLLLDIPNEGGLNPTKSENPVIHPKDVNRLDKVESADIAIAYGTKINWSNAKIARDIMQNFYDGNGHTLEGTSINMERAGDEYKIRITGQGDYDYTHLESIGDSTKDGDSSSAGNFGEGTRIVAVNLLAKGDVKSIQYGCGDWAMEFGCSSNDLAAANMTQKLTKNTVPIQGNYIEFSTKDETLVKEILKSKDYFYHPANEDFQNLDYENDFFGFKVLKPDDRGYDTCGNVYVVQRYETDRGIEGSLRGMTVVFKKMPDDSELEKMAPRNMRFRLNTGRDRMALDDKEMAALAEKYAYSMSDKELAGAVASLEKIWSSDSPWNSKFENSDSDCALAFVKGLLKAAVSRDIKLDFSSNPKFAALGSYESNDTRHWLKDEGYICALDIMQKLGMQSASSAYKNAHILHSLEPTPVEAKKIKLIHEAVSLFAENDEFGLNIDNSKMSEYIFNARDLKSANIRTVPNGVMLDRQYLEQSTDFMKLISETLAGMIDKDNNTKLPSYSYRLTDLIRTEFNTFISDPVAAQKLLVLKKLYDSLL